MQGPSDDSRDRHGSPMISIPRSISSFFCSHAKVNCRFLVPVKATLNRIRALSALQKLPTPIDEVKFPSKIRSVNNWTCNWTEDDDRKLMKSVVKFGVGAWDQVKEDQELELTSKILPTSDDATPQVIFELFEFLADLSKLSAA